MGRAHILGKLHRLHIVGQSGSDVKCSRWAVGAIERRKQVALHDAAACTIAESWIGRGRQRQSPH